MRLYELVLCAGLASVIAVSCGEEKTPLAPEVKGSALPSSAPKSAAAKKFSVSPWQSRVTLSMDAADEKIRGRVGGLEGTVFIDTKDLTMTTGNIAVDLDTLEIYQKKKTPETGEWGEETLQPLQNKHARAWLEIDDSAPAPMRTKNRRVEFRIEKVEAVSEKDVTKLPGGRRTVTLKAKGELLLHQRAAQRLVDLEIAFGFEGDNPTSVTLRTVSPLEVNLAEFDVRPRDSFGKLAKDTLESLGSKVARTAQIQLQIELVPGDPPAAPTAPAASAAASAEPEPSASADASASASADASASAAPSAEASAAPSASAAASAAPKASASASAGKK